MLRGLLPSVYRSLLAGPTLQNTAACCTCGSQAASSSTQQVWSAAAAAAAAAPFSTASSATLAAAAGSSGNSSSSSSSPPADNASTSTSSSSSSSNDKWFGRNSWCRSRFPSTPHINAPLAAPWVPTSQLTKRKTYQKRARFLIQALEVEQRAQLAAGKKLPRFSAGDILEVTTVVPEADRKAYTYKGVCIARANKGPRSWFKLYNVFPDAGGFIQHFPLYMPDLVSVRVVGRLPKAKRSKLYHLLQDESPKHVYQTAVEVAAAAQ